MLFPGLVHTGTSHSWVRWHGGRVFLDCREYLFSTFSLLPVHPGGLELSCCTMRRRRNRYSRRQVEPYASEAAMCEVLRAAALAEGWQPYPEQGGWDLLLVLPSGLQVGVQAKLRPNVDVLAQALLGEGQVGPEVHAVLVPSCSGAFREVARALGVLVLEASDLDASRLAPWGRAAHLPELVAGAQLHQHRKRHWLPPFVPQLPAGVPGPRRVTPWQVGAAKLCALLRERGEQGVLVSEARELGLATSTWQRRWLQKRVPGSRPSRWVPRPGVALPDCDFPWVAAGLRLPEPQVGSAAPPLHSASPGSLRLSGMTPAR